MNIAISGISGLTGSFLSERLLNRGDCVVSLLRNDFQQGQKHLTEKLDGVDAVVHLAGAPILKRWTPKWKEIIRKSRTETTSLLVGAINKMSVPPEILVSASAVGIYDIYEVHDEYSTNYADDFLANVCKEWEEEALKVDDSKVRLCITRFGLVLSEKAGALKQMLLPFKLGLGGRIGDGLQPMPFIHIDDLTSALEWLISSKDKKGVFNLVAPQMISNLEFTKALGKVIKRPAFLTLPEWGLKLLYGDAAQVLVKGQKVVSKRLQEEGFRFTYPDIHSALDNLLKANKKGTESQNESVP